MSIPEKRAVRLSSERVSLLDSNGNLCLGNSSIPQTLKDEIENGLFELNTTVIYKTNPEKVIRLNGVDNTVSLEDIKDKNFTVTTRARYNVTVVENADCTQVENQVNGTMIEMYEFSPGAGNSSNNYTLILTLCIVIPSVIILLIIILVIVVIVYIRKKRFLRF